MTGRPAVFLALMLAAFAAFAASRFDIAHEFGRAGSGDGPLDNPWRLAVDPRNGDIAVADTARHRVVVFARSGRFETSFGGRGVAEGALQSPCAIAFLPDGRGILVSDTDNDRIQLFDRSGRFIRTFAPAGESAGRLSRPTGLAVASNGDVYVADSGNNRIQVYAPTGSHIAAFGTRGSAAGQFSVPYDVAIARDGRTLAVADYGNHRVQLFDMGGRFLRAIGGFGTAPGKFWGASGVAFARDGTLLVADAANRRVQWFDLQGGESGAFGRGGDAPGEFVQPHAVTADWNHGTVYVSDFYLNRVQAFLDARFAPPPVAPGGEAAPLLAIGAGICLVVACGLLWMLRRRGTNPLAVARAIGAALRRRWRQRPVVSAEWLLLAASLLVAALLNRTLWNAAAETPTGEAVFAGAWLAPAILLLAAGQFLVIACLVPRALARPAIVLLVSLAAALDFYMRRYHIYLDVTMMQNVLGTNPAEARQQLTGSALARICLWAAGSTLVVSCVRLRRDPLRTALVRRGRYVLAAAIVAIACLGIAQGRVKRLAGQMPEALLLANPASALANLPRAYFSGALPAGGSRVPVGIDATMRPVHGPPRLLVLVVGESTRGDNWGLNGYARDTTPELRRAGVVNFPHVTSCGSNTLTSVPCMFSPWGRRGYDAERIQRSEGLLDVLSRAGYRVEWIENSAACLGVCRGVPTTTVSADGTPGGCKPNSCLDGGLVDALAQALREPVPAGSADSAGAGPGRVIVLHMAGSHGPGYHRRYPGTFARFQPECVSDDVAGCDDRAIVNSYDNSVLYTDHVLAQVIDLLRGQPAYASAMLFTSDHGESLGENGIYMHGTPYPIAPRQQLHVPMVFWASPGFARQRGMDLRCVADRAKRPTSHDSLFHSVLDLLQVETSLLDRSVDWLDGCTGEDDGAGPPRQRGSAQPL